MAVHTPKLIIGGGITKLLNMPGRLIENIFFNWDYLHPPELYTSPSQQYDSI